MGWRVFGDPFETSDLTGITKFQKITPNEDKILIGVRTWVIVYNNPTFTSLNMKIYTDDGGYPKKLLHTSTNSLLKAQVHTLANGVKEIYFDFNQVPLVGGNGYHFVINGVGYTGSETSHLAWMKAFPDSIYETEDPVTLTNLGTAPYQIYLIGGDI